MPSCDDQKCYLLMPLLIMLLAAPVDVHHFTSQGYTMFTQINGDLNGDTLSDCIMVMEQLAVCSKIAMRH